MVVLVWLLAEVLAEPIGVPAGAFVQGGGRAPDEQPPRQVTLSAYRLDAEEVTIAAFEEFVRTAANEARWWSPEGWAWHQQNPDGAGAAVRRADRPPDHPVVAVSWYEADAYCRWQGGQLPTEAQWERAACPSPPEDSAAVNWYAGSKYGRVTAVLTQSATQAAPEARSPLGTVHMAGNVWEWTADWYHRETYAREGAATDPTGPEAGTWRVLRGGSYMNLPSYCSCTHREPALPDRIALTVGFRCAYPDSP